MRDQINYQGIDFILLNWLMPLERIVAAYPLTALLAAAGFWYKRRFATTWALLASWLGLMYVQSVHASSLWENFSPLRMTQLPYRALSSDAFIRLAGCAFVFGVIDAKLHTRKQLHLLLMVAIAAGGIASTLWQPIHLPEARPPLPLSELAERLQDTDHNLYRLRMSKRYDDQSLKYDFIPRMVKIEELGKEPPFSRPMVWAEDPASMTIHTLEGYPPYDIQFRVTVEKAPAALHLRQFHFKGWQIYINDEKLDDDHKNISWGAGDNARIRIAFSEPGSYTVRAEYAGPPYWLLRNIVMVILLTAIVVAMRRVIKTGPAQ
jgi:hypothetical protein